MRTHIGRLPVEYFGSSKMEGKAEMLHGPFLIFKGIRCRYFENTSITEGLYL